MDGYAIRAADVARRDGGRAGPARGHRRRRAPGRRPTSTVRRGTAVRIATGAPVPPAPTPSSRSRRRRRSTRTGAAGPRGRDATGPVPAACLVHERGRDRAARSGAAGSDLAAGATLLEAGHRADAGRGRARRRRRRRPHRRSTAGRASPSSRPATRSARRAADSARPASPTRTARASRALVDGRRRRGRSTSGSRRTDLDDVLARLRRGARRRRRRDHRVGRRVGRAVRRRQDRVRDDRPDRPVAGRRPAGQAVRVRARRRDRAAATPVLLFGLPGNPVSSARHLRAVRPAGDPARSRAAATCSATGRPGASSASRSRKSHGPAGLPPRRSRERDADGAPVRDEQGRVRVRLAGGQGSHVISALAAADALAVIPEADDALAGRRRGRALVARPG